MLKSQEIKDIVKKIKDQEIARRNYTFRLSKELVENFKMNCKKKRVPNSAILEELMKQFNAIE